MFKKTFQAFLDAILFSDFFIAIAALAQTLFSYRLMNLKADYLVLLFVALATFMVYNFDFLRSKHKLLMPFQSRRLAWKIKHFRAVNLFFYVCFLVCGLLFLFYFGIKSQIVLSLFFLLALTYYVRFLKFKGRRINLREVPFLKPFVISFVWVGVTFIFPFVEAEKCFLCFFDAKNQMFVIARSLFVVALCLPFDLRDAAQDTFYNLKTIANVIGEKKTLWFSVFLLMLQHLIIELYSPQQPVLFFLVSASICFLGAVILKSTFLKKDDYYYYFYIDGLLVLQGFSLCFA
ncbi:MAG: hypothetical protein K2Q03_09475 [Sphingobacteriaceae bacterium]|nr:hypothetical protein [Sphingobacteriaceae bacterium]